MLGPVPEAAAAPVAGPSPRVATAPEAEPVMGGHIARSGARPMCDPVSMACNTISIPLVPVINNASCE